MKNNILIGCLGVMAFLFSSCEKEGITMYEESPYYHRLRYRENPFADFGFSHK